MPDSSDVLGDAVLSRSKELSLETGKPLLESMSLVLSLCTIHGTDWLLDKGIVFPWFE